MKLSQFLKNLSDDEKFVVRLEKIDGDNVEKVFLPEIEPYLQYNILGFKKIEDLIILTIVEPIREEINKETVPTFTASMFKDLHQNQTDGKAFVPKDNKA